MPEKLLKKYWGYDSFRGSQKEIVANIIEGKDILAILPTGGGKSICYQIPALLSEGTTIVISPLIALMQDQVDNLKKLNIQSSFLNSSLLPQEKNSILNNLSLNKYKLLYLAPESLNSNKLMSILKRIKISRIVIDEAHCISEWGHDFRPDYKRIIKVFSKNKINVQIVALTATANNETIKDIVNTLELKEPFISISSFDRKNLFIGVKKFFTGLGKFNYLKNIIKNSSKVLVYCSTRQQTEELSKKIANKLKLETSYYHAGCSSLERTEKQDKFRTGKIKVLCATNAFGMGIDIPDIDTVVYFNFPSSIEDYYQGIGRAGRNPNLNAISWLLYTNKDIKQQKDLISVEIPTLKEIKLIIEKIKNGADKTFLRDKYKISESILNSIFFINENDQIEADEILKKLKSINERKNTKFLKIKDFTYFKGCKRKFVLEYFNENIDKCTNCSYCDKG